MDNYSLIYKLVWSDEEKTHAFRDTNDLNSFIKCLHRGIAFLDWTPRTISSFSEFKIWLKNYDFSMNSGGYYDFEDNLDEPVLVSDRPWFTPRDEDVTNEVLAQRSFSSEDMNLHFDGEFLHVYEKKYYVEENKKPRELLDLIFSTKEKYDSKILSYSTLIKELEEKDYYELDETHINYNWARNILKDRLKTIKEELKIENKIIALSKNNIELLI